MSPELDKQICEKYPKIFIERKLTAKESCMSWGFSHRDGWGWLLDKLCFFIQNRVDNDKNYVLDSQTNKYVGKEIEQVVFLQVKEKMGCLRIYHRGGDEVIQNSIDYTEFLSGFICEFCGTTENIGKTKGWIKTCCKDCADKEGFKGWCSSEKSI